MSESEIRNDSTRRNVRNAYADIATGQAGGCCGSTPSCCGSSRPDALARDIGYSEDDLACLPEGANMGLSCGNPTALASLQEGEVVLDLGSGGGFDVFIAAGKVGPSGRAIGVDMTPEMLGKARQNAIAFHEQAGMTNVEFRLGEIEHLPIADNSIDVIISNCVINLSPDKPQVWREMYRVLKPGGRVAVSDIALRQPLPDALRKSVEALVGCVAGAVLIDQTKAMSAQAGLVNVTCDANTDAIDAMVDCNDPLYARLGCMLPAGKKMSDYVVSLHVTAHKAAACRCGG